MNSKQEHILLFERHLPVSVLIQLRIKQFVFRIISPFKPSTRALYSSFEQTGSKYIHVHNTNKYKGTGALRFNSTKRVQIQLLTLDEERSIFSSK